MRRVRVRTTVFGLASIANALDSAGASLRIVDLPGPPVGPSGEGTSGAGAVSEETSGTSSVAVKRKSVVPPGVAKRSRSGRPVCVVPPRLKDQSR